MNQPYQPGRKVIIQQPKDICYKEKQMKYQILHGDNRETLKNLPDNSIDAIVTDPPYGIGFLGKDWDSKKATETTSKMVAVQNLPSGMKHTSLADDLEFQYWMRDLWLECYRVLKPGGHVLAFSAARTYHHMAMSLQTAGFEIRDQIMWIYSSGFPKSQDVGKSIDRAAGKKDPNYTGSKNKGHNLAYGSEPVGGRPCGKCGKDDTHKSICADTECGLKYTHQTEAGKAWAGWGTALKPAHEPIALARKPIKLSIAKNCQKYGVGALNIDACRIPVEGADTRSGGSDGWDRVEFGQAEPNKSDGDGYVPNDLGRFPSNVLGDIPDYQKYFYCPKVGRAERHVGFDAPETQEQMLASIGGYFVDHEGNKIKSGNKAFVPNHGEIYTHGLNDVIKKIRGTDTATSGNNHPTVKPIELMKYLIKLITPPGGTVLDPFNGSGSTGCAAVELGYEYIGCELDENYVAIAERRIEAWYAHVNPTTYNQIFEQDSK
jgi:site-specific DNA-methyltransferase (adenine-specific)